MDLMISFLFQDSGESCSLELPYRIKASDSSGKKSPIVSTVNYSSGFVDISQPSTISNSKHNTLLAVAYARWQVAHGCAGIKVVVMPTNLEYFPLLL